MKGGPERSFYSQYGSTRADEIDLMMMSRHSPSRGFLPPPPMFNMNTIDPMELYDYEHRHLLLPPPMPMPVPVFHPTDVPNSRTYSPYRRPVSPRIPTRNPDPYVGVYDEALEEPNIVVPRWHFMKTPVKPGDTEIANRI